MRYLPHKLSVLLFAIGIFKISIVSASLIVRPNEMVYDTDMNLTWLADANSFRTSAQTNTNLVNEIIAANGGAIYDTPNGFDTPSNSGVHYLSASNDFNIGDGSMSWWGAKAWVGYLNSISYKGYSDWRLPISDACIVGPGCYNGELTNLYYGELGAKLLG